MRTVKNLLAVLFILTLTPFVKGQKKGTVYLFVGGYTKPVKEQGIAVYEFNPQTGSLVFRSVAGEIDNPSYLAISRDNKYVYSVSEKNHGAGIVVAYKFDHNTAMLTKLNQSSSGGDGPCYIAVDDASTHVFAANYGSGSLAAIALNKDGSLDAATVQAIQHSGKSINKESQSGPHVHSTVLSPDNHFLLSADLGIDRIYAYSFKADKMTNALGNDTAGYVRSAPGNGPRHICFHPDGKHVYVVNEMGGNVDVFQYEQGNLKQRQTITMLPANFKGIVEAADIHISPDGKFLYASNREVRNELVIFSIDRHGLLHFVLRQSVLGAVPRNFVIDPTGKFLLVANQNTNEVVVFKRDLTTGLLKFNGNKIKINAPACLKFENVGR